MKMDRPTTTVFIRTKRSLKTATLFDYETNASYYQTGDLRIKDELNATIEAGPEYVDAGHQQFHTA